MTVDCLGRKIKVGDWVSYTNTWQTSGLSVGRVFKIKDKTKKGKGRVHSEIQIKRNNGCSSIINRSNYVCLMESPFENSEGSLGVGEKYKM